MERHLSKAVLLRLLSKPRHRHGGPEESAAVAHVARCSPCHKLVSRLVYELQASGSIKAAEWSSPLVSLVLGEQRQVVQVLQARSSWAALRRLERSTQLQRMRETQNLRTVEMFDSMLESARSLASGDQYRAGEIVGVALDLVPLLRVSEEEKAELRGEALVVLANCRRLAADWTAAMAAISEAQALLKEPGGQARLHSIHASVCCDTGHLDQALELLQKSAVLFKVGGDVRSGRRIAIQYAATLLVAGRIKEAVEVSEILGQIGDNRLEVLARGIVIEGLVKLGRSYEALQVYIDGQGLWDQISELRPRVEFLEALLLEGFGHYRDAERMLKEQAQACADSEQYKEAFRTFLFLFELHFRHDAFEKAAEACDAAVQVIDLAGDTFHSHIRDAWVQLGKFARLRTVTISHIKAVGHYLSRSWPLPATCGPFQAELTPAFLPVATVNPPTQDENTQLGPVALDGNYKTVLETFDAGLIKAALERNSGEIKATSRTLGISKNTLKARMAKYGLL